MPNGQPAARVFIWYPDLEEERVGHAAMYIGNYEVGKKFEQSLDPNSPHYVMPNALERRFGFQGVHYNDNYVSWWPDGSGTVTGRDGSEPKLGLYADVQAEHSQPHVVYDIHGLNVGSMRAKWHETRDKPGASYQLVRKNCAGIVMRVLESGGALKLIGKLSSAWFGHRLYWTPKRVAQVCNQLRDKGYATKTKAGNCPGKDSKFLAALGMR